jgi:anti-anti-sigma factor
MRLRINLGKPHRLINLHGTLDLSNRDELLDRLTSLTVPPYRRYTLDLTAVTFMDHSGIHIVQTFDHHVRDTGATLHIGSVSPHVARLLYLAAQNGFPTHLMPGTTPRRARLTTTSRAA